MYCAFLEQGTARNPFILIRLLGARTHTQRIKKGGLGAVSHNTLGRVISIYNQTAFKTSYFLVHVR